MNEKTLTDIKFWEENSNDENFSDQKDSPVSHFISEKLTQVENKVALEIGCYPGNFIPTISRLGYIVSGIDYHPKLPNLQSWLLNNNIKFGDFYQGDFFKVLEEINTKYDLVYSLGLIEHFTNWEEVLILHASFVDKNGILVITCPNFAGFWQYIYHRIWDKYNLDRHYLPSMNPDKWVKILKQNGFTIEYAGYFGGGFFWNENKKLKGFSAKMEKFYTMLIANRRKILPVKFSYGRSFECHCGIIARKINS